MNRHAVICNVMFGSLPFTAVWEVAVFAATETTPPTWLVAAGAAPQVLAAAVVVAILASAPKPTSPVGPVPAPRRAVPAAARRRELAR